MSDSPIISVEGLGKSYMLRHRAGEGGYRKFSDVLMSAALSPLRFMRDNFQEPAEVFWAMKDVSFELGRGEVLGVIGHNGAGKSTLLKLLSRITDPSEGRITLNGTVASLLEVGTGFHPELTGRENIFLNGAILGMTRAQVRARFDQIVTFAGIERFLDTPVKRYSSGMYVRLAFAVAAHMEPEVLIIDELLSVGDAEFQQKCLGKMDELARGGSRSVIFVSHNLSAVSRLCSRVMVLDHGRVVFDGKTSEGIAFYTGMGPSDGTTVNLTSQRRPQAVKGSVKLSSITLSAASSGQHHAWIIDYGTDLEVEVIVQSDGSLHEIEPGLALCSSRGFELASWTSAVTDARVVPIQPGLNVLTFRWCGLRLVPGSYYLGLGLRSPHGMEDYLPEVARFEIVPTGESTSHGVGSFHGSLVPQVECRCLPA